MITLVSGVYVSKGAEKVQCDDAHFITPQVIGIADGMYYYLLTPVSIEDHLPLPLLLLLLPLLLCIVLTICSSFVLFLFLLLSLYRS